MTSLHPHQLGVHLVRSPVGPDSLSQAEEVTGPHGSNSGCHGRVGGLARGGGVKELNADMVPLPPYQVLPYNGYNHSLHFIAACVQLQAR